MSRKATPIEKVEAEITDVKANIKELQVEIKASKDRDEKTALRSDKKDAVDRLKMLDARLTMLLQQRSSTTDSGHLSDAVEQLRIDQGEVLDMLREQKTDVNSMSKAGVVFADQLLGSLGFGYHVMRKNMAAGENYDFDWTGGEDARTPFALTFLEGAFELPLVEDQSLHVVDMRKQKLRPVEGGNKRSTGETDLGIEIPNSHSGDNRFMSTVAFVELKANSDAQNKIRIAQLLLQQVSLSRMSRFKQATVVLGTDCCKQWWLVHFSKRNELFVEQFEHGDMCLRAFESLIKSISDRMVELAALPTISEGNYRADGSGSSAGGNAGDGGGGSGGDGHSGSGASDRDEGKGSGGDDTGFDGHDTRDCGGVNDSQAPQHAAIMREVYLQRVAHALSAEFALEGDDKLRVPSWALAANSEHSTPQRRRLTAQALQSINV